MDEKNGGPQLSFREDTGELYSLDKKERILMKEVLRLSLATSSSRRRLLDRFGEEGFRIAISLLEQMGVKVEKPI